MSLMRRTLCGCAAIWALSVPMKAAAQGVIFLDGFESGDTSAWSVALWAEVTVDLPGGVPLTLNFVPPGTYFMGSPASERSREDDEDLHQVEITQGFFLGRYEVTQAQWAAVMGSLPSLSCSGGGPYSIGPSYPVYCVSWDDIVGPGGFIETLNTHVGVTAFRLPTEAEWERAVRAGNQHRFNHGDVLECADNCGECAAHDEFMWWCGSEPFGLMQPVGSRTPNGFGLHDMHGNLVEWMQDWYQFSLGTLPMTDPSGPNSGTTRVNRGGVWNGYALASRSASRHGHLPDDRNTSIGFRVAMSP